MERKASIEDAKRIIGANFIGVDELRNLLKLSLKLPKKEVEVPYTIEQLVNLKDDYILIYGASTTMTEDTVNLLFLRSIFGYDPEASEPCFYNQDWYMKESFMKRSLDDKWYLIKKNIYSDSRSKSPIELEKQYSFPSAILCAYVFFAMWLLKDEQLWLHDFIWCSDLDKNSDRIYVGRYIDFEGLNKNGFSIHRHLSIRNCYGSITTV